MKTFTSRFLFTGLLLAACFSVSYSQNAPVFTSIQGKLIRTTPRLADIDKNSMFGAPLKITRSGDGFAGGITDPEKAEESIFSNAKKNSDKPVLSNGFTPSLNAPTATLNQNFDGQVFPNFAPSDNNLAVGPNHIIQIINHSSGSAFKIWNKSAGVVQNSVILSSITGVTGDGDPVVLYDQLADRWVLTEFGVTGNVRYINTLIIAVSKTSDPTGQWNVYHYVVSNNGSSYFVDYPKYAIWNNALYATSNDFNTAGTSYLGSSIYAFDIASMISGAPSATMVRTRLNNASQRYYSMAPVCQEGMTSSNQSGLFAFLQDNSWVSGSTSDSIYVFEFTPNFANPSASVVGPFTQLKTQLPFNTNTGNLSQPGTSQTIQSLSQRLMHKVIYRNFGSSESIVCNTTDLQGTGTGVHWWELTRPESGSWTIQQEGFYHPDNNNRFMGSIAINANHDIGLLYNVVSSSVYPSARFTGRSLCDPAGQMTLTETVVQNGTIYEGNNRYGDYNSLSVDPSNGSYWGTAQYNASGAGTYGNWKTKIVNFTLSSSCGGGGNSGTVTGATPLCIGDTATYLSNGDPNGTWTSTNTSVATVNSSTGFVTAMGAGTTNITYTVGGSSSFQNLIVNASPNAGTVSGASSVCPGSSTTFTSNGAQGGTWRSDNTSVATVNASTGSVTGIATGTANIFYKVTNSCGADSSSKSISVSDNPTASIICPSNISQSMNGNRCSVSINTPNPDVSGNCVVSKLTWIMTGNTTGSSNPNGINYVGAHTFNVGITTVTYTVTNGSSSTASCSFTVTVRNKKCPNSPAAPTTNSNDQTVNISTPDKGKLKVTVFPNPSETYFTLTIQSSSSDNVEISVYSINGKMIQKLSGNASETFRFGDKYVPGTYVVKVQQGSEQTTLKVVK